MFSGVQCFELLPKRNLYGAISENFALIWYYLAPLANK